MDNKKIPTLLGTVIIVIIAATVGVMVWKYEEIKGRDFTESQIAVNISKPAAVKTQIENQQDQAWQAEAQEFPTIHEQPRMNLEDIIKQALYKRTPDWKIKNYSVTVTVETNKENHAIGRFTYDGYNIVKDGTYHNTGDGIWFAAKENQIWTLVNISHTGYWGSCQDFKKYNFPADMTPDCWDTEKNMLVDTANPKRFYQNGFTKSDKKELVLAYIEYGNINVPEGFGCKEFECQQPDRIVYVRVNKIIGNYLRGTFFIGRLEGFSSIGFYATKQSGEWIIVYSGQDSPPCGRTDLDDFPKEIIEYPKNCHK